MYDIKTQDFINCKILQINDKIIKSFLDIEMFLT